MESVSQWTKQINSSRLHGNVHGDTFYCQDLHKLKDMYKSGTPKIKKIEIYTDGQQIFGYEVFYAK